ncbi:MAG: endonuclease domain-containing protein [Micrococcales bacterium]|nr:endonuclease domain-containing protein [Micrococcales bacterium]
MPIRPGASRPEPPSLPDVFFADVHPPWVCAERVRRTQWVRLSRGAYLPVDVVDPVQQALARVVAVDHRAVGPHWFSHTSAALVWGLPLRHLPQVSHLRQRTRPSANRDVSVVRHAGPVDTVDQAVVSGLPVTGLSLTAADCLRTLAPLEALVVADGALRAGADRARIDALLAGRRGSGAVRCAVARAVAAVADPGAESIPETITRFCLLAAGLPTPQTQVRVATGQGTFWADLGYPQWKLLIEYDGRSKYDNPDGFLRERDRQRAVEAEGWRVVRLTREDLRDRARLVRRVRAELPGGLRVTARPHLTF